MPIINYYEELESFIDTNNKATKFQVIVNLKTGSVVRSSGLPIGFLSQMIAAVETADASGTALSIWDRENKQIVLLPKDNIESVRIALE